jgi:thiol-disulfide isomerase/thioredoxin
MRAEVSTDRRSFLGSAMRTVAVAQFGIAGCAMALSTGANKLQVEGDLPSLGGATQWLNSQPLTTRGLRGSVVLFNFWTFSCINSIWVLPYVRAWAAKYKKQGLVVIGVQAPEFEFEKSADNVRWAVNDRMIDYPIAIENGVAIWRAFDNDYWPALYFVDARGHIRHHQFGEGEYEQSEEVIQQLLADAGAQGIGHQLAKLWVLGPIRHEDHVGRARLGPWTLPDRLRHRGRAQRPRRLWCQSTRSVSFRIAGCSIPSRRRVRPCEWPGAGSRQLRLVRHFQRSGRQ